MNKITAIILLLLISFGGFAQLSAAEQLSMDIEKLAQMKSMLTSLYEGYSTISKGYSQITDLAKGNFDLHKTYLDGLSLVSPAVKKYQKIGNIITNQAGLIAEFKAAFLGWQRGGLFRAPELVNMQAFGEDLMDRAGKGLDELLIVVTPGILKMNDEERIGAIDRIDKGLNEQMVLMREFIKVQNQLAQKRKQGAKDIEVMRKLNGLN